MQTPEWQKLKELTMPSIGKDRQHQELLHTSSGRSGSLNWFSHFGKQLGIYYR